MFMRTTFMPAAQARAAMPLHVAGIGRALEAMHQNRGEPRRAHRLRLPMAMAKNAARVGGIDFDGFGDGGEAKGGTGKKVAGDGLQVAADEPRVGLKRGEPRRKFCRRLATMDWLASLRFARQMGRPGPRDPYALKGVLGRLVGIEPTTS